MVIGGLVVVVGSLRLVTGGWWVGGWCKKKRTSGTGVTELQYSASEHHRVTKATYYNRGVL